MDEITLMILKVIVSVCAAMITAYVIPYLKTLRNDVRYKRLIDMVMVAVQAAEQAIKKPGEQKKAEVEKFVSDWLEKQGIKISAEELDQLIESAVFTMKKGDTNGQDSPCLYR